MSIYHYSDSKTVDQIRFKRTGNGAVRAYIQSKDDAPVAGLHATLDALKAKDYDCIPYVLDGKPVLEVRGFKKEAEIIGALDKAGAISGDAKIVKEKEDKVSWADTFRKRSLQLSGAAMMVADIGFLTYGAKERSWEDASAGLAYLGGSSVLLGYGRNDQSQMQIRENAQLILDYAKAKGMDVTKDTAVSEVGKERKKTPLRQLNEFFKKHPSEIGNMSYVVAGGLIAKSAAQHRLLATPRAEMTQKQVRDMRLSGLGDTLLGSTTIASGLTATLVKEKAKDPDVDMHSTGLAAVADWVRESPLRAASYGYIASTCCHAATTLGDTLSAKSVLKDASKSASEKLIATNKLKAMPWRTLFVSATLVGELLMSISSKGHGEGVQSDHTIDDSVIAVAADLISKQPKHMRNDLIQEMSQFLGRPEVLATQDSRVTEELRKQVAIADKNPWSKHIAEHQDVARSDVVQKPQSIVSNKARVIPAWQAKIRQADTSRSESQQLS